MNDTDNEPNLKKQRKFAYGPDCTTMFINVHCPAYVNINKNKWVSPTSLFALHRRSETDTSLIKEITSHISHDSIEKVKCVNVEWCFQGTLKEQFNRKLKLSHYLHNPMSMKSQQKFHSPHNFSCVAAF